VLSLGPPCDISQGRIENAGEVRSGDFRQALPVHTLNFEETSGQATPGGDVACVRVEHQVSIGSCFGDQPMGEMAPPSWLTRVRTCAFEANECE
jgi:hypothetical protein